jgi:predicted PurR-regulated permease PerM
LIDRFHPLVRNLVLAAVFVLVGWFCWSVRSVLNPLILGYLLAFVVHPLVLRLEQRGWRRRKAVNFIFTAFAVGFVLLAFVIFLQGRGLARELSGESGLQKTVSDRVDQALAEYKDEVNWVMRLFLETKSNKASTAPSTASTEKNPSGAETPSSAAQHPPEDLDAEHILAWISDWWRGGGTENRANQAGELGLKVAGGTLVFLQGIFGSLVEMLLLLILLPIYTYFLLFELERIHKFVTRYLPLRQRARLVKIGTQIGEVLANFFRGRLLVCLCKGAFLSLGLWIAGVPYALLLGMGTGFLSLIPFVGSSIGFVMALLVALLQHSLVSALLRAGLVFAAAEVFENYLLLPKILGDSLGLHPVVVIFALMAGGASLGMFGLLIALPLAASLVIVCRELLLPVLADLADKDDGSIVT